MRRLDDEGFKEVARFFAALAGPARLRMLEAMRESERSVGELVSLTGFTQPNVSKHLAVLSQAGLVARTRRGTSIYYSIADPRVYKLCELVCTQIGRQYAERSGRHRMFAAAAR